MITWVHLHKRLCAYLILTALLLKLAAPALSQQLTPPKSTGTRFVVVCTATGLQYIELPLLSADASQLPAKNNETAHQWSADHCLLCNLTDSAVLPSSDSARPWYDRRTAFRVSLRDPAPPPSVWQWPSAIARAPPQALISFA